MRFLVGRAEAMREGRAALRKDAQEKKLLETVAQTDGCSVYFETHRKMESHSAAD